MHSVLQKGSDQSTIPFASLSSPWLSTKQLQLSISKCGTTETTAERRYDMKQTDSPYQEGAALARSNLNMHNISFQPGLFETDPKKGEASTKAYLSWGSEDYVDHQIQSQHNHPLACSPIPFSESYFGSIITTYGPNAVVYPKIMGITSARVVVPLDYTEGIPIYVNAKQYNAILRRRQIRAKLVVHNKIAKSRKPYLHESRHLHAVNRARGSGGRFLNTKKTQEAKPSTQMYANDLSLQPISEPSGGIHPSKSNSWGTSTPSGSDVSDSFNSDDVFQQHDFRGSVSSFPSVHNAAPGNGGVLFIDRCARISTAM